MWCDDEKPRDAGVFSFSGAQPDSGSKSVAGVTRVMARAGPGPVKPKPHASLTALPAVAILAASPQTSIQ